MPELKGIIAPSPVFFNENGELDLERLSTHLSLLHSGGVDGVLILGSTGEFFHLRPEERIAVAERAAEAVNGKMKLLVGTGDLRTSDAIAYTKHAKQIGADAAVIISPFYWPLQERHLYRYYADIAEAVEIPILLYNYPSMTGVHLSPELVRRLALEYPHVVGIKETIDSPTHIRDVICAVLPERPDFAVFAGADELVLYNLIVGGAGSIASSWNFAFGSGTALHKAFAAGDMETAKREQKRLSVLSRIYDIDPCLGTIVKEALYALNMGPKPHARPPALPLSDSARAKLRAILAEAGLLKNEGAGPTSG